MLLKELKSNKGEFKYPGIYHIIYQGETIYIGQSREIRQRLLSHNRFDYRIEEKKRDIGNPKRNQESVKMNIAMYEFIKKHHEEIEVEGYEVPLELLNKVEEQEIKKYKPRYNYGGVVAEFTPYKRG